MHRLAPAVLVGEHSLVLSIVAMSVGIEPSARYRADFQRPALEEMPAASGL